MKRIRQLMGDRLSGGVLAAMAAYMLVLQVLMTGFACGSTIQLQAEGGVHFVICHPSNPAGASVEQSGSQDGRGHECPCAVCHIADPALMAAMPQGGDLGPAFTRSHVAFLPPLGAADPLPTPHLLGLAPDTRGPPSLFA